MVEFRFEVDKDVALMFVVVTFAEEDPRVIAVALVLPMVKVPVVSSKVV